MKQRNVCFALELKELRQPIRSTTVTEIRIISELEATDVDSENDMGFREGDILFATDTASVRRYLYAFA